MRNRRNPIKDPVYAAQRIRNMYPDVCNRMTPHVHNAVVQLGPRRNLSQAELNRMSYQVARNSYAADDPPYGLGGRGLSDIAKILILAYLLG